MRCLGLQELFALGVWDISADAVFGEGGGPGQTNAKVSQVQLSSFRCPKASIPRTDLSRIIPFATASTSWLERLQILITLQSRIAQVGMDSRR